MRRWRSMAVVLCVATTLWCLTPAGGNSGVAVARTIEFKFTPSKRNQIALWVERADGTFLRTARLTQAVAVRGIGNRPGASQMNSAFRWPYGRREGVLPVWAHRRASAPQAMQFKRVIFQDREGEGFASSTVPDSSPESYFCLSFTQEALTRETRRQEALDAISCATKFNSDKGRFLNAEDVMRGYAEPVEVDGQGIMRPLGTTSLYPPRRDATACAGTACSLDTTDVGQYNEHALQVMPDLDAVTMATPPADLEQSILFTVPDDWASGRYTAFIEVNVEGDYNQAFNDTSYPIPTTPTIGWDGWAIRFGYPYRGQPSMVYQVPFDLADSLESAEFSTIAPSGYGDIHGFGDGGGTLHPMDGRITNDPANLLDPPIPESGADRLRLGATGSYRFKVTVAGKERCGPLPPPDAPTALVVSPDPHSKHSHQWGVLHFVVPGSSRPIAHYDVRYSATEITTADASSFTRALPAMAAQTDTVGLMVPTSGAPGTPVDVAFGGMEPLTHYWVALRAVDSCNVPGPYAVAELTTTRINFTQLSGCFVATAAYGTKMHPEVQALRRIRDLGRTRSPLFAAAADIYERAGPAAAAVIARSDLTRAVVRNLLSPMVTAAVAVSPMVAR